VALDELSHFGRMGTASSKDLKDLTKPDPRRASAWYWRRFWLVVGVSAAYLALWLYIGVISDTAQESIATKVVFGSVCFTILGGFLLIAAAYVLATKARGGAKLAAEATRG